MNLIKDQPTPEIFFKSFLQFDCGNLIQLFSFEGEALSYLLDERFK